MAFDKAGCGVECGAASFGVSFVMEMPLPLRPAWRNRDIAIGAAQCFHAMTENADKRSWAESTNALSGALLLFSFLGSLLPRRAADKWTPPVAGT